MISLSRLLPPLPGFTALSRTYAPWPVWSGSTTKPGGFQPMPKKAVIKLWHRARELDRNTHEPGRHGGAVGRTALTVLRTLAFDFLNHATGRLDPSYAAIARKAGVSRRAVSDALKRLRELGLIHRIRRCMEDWQDGRFRLKQESNAYVILPESHWKRRLPEPQEAPAPEAGTWGEPTPMPSVLAQAVQEAGDLRTVVRVLEVAPKSGLEAALARLGRAFVARDS